MPKLATKVPKYCRHARGQAFVKIAGKQVWLGRYGDPIAREKYDRLVAEWLANGRTLPPPPLSQQAQPATILHILAPYWRWAKDRYTAAEADTIRSALRVVESLYGSNNHHIIEGIYKGFARAMRQAIAIDPRKADAVPSTKGILGG